MVRVFLVAGALPPFWARTLAQRLRAPARMFASPSALSLRLPEVWLTVAVPSPPKSWVSWSCSSKIRSWISAAWRNCCGVMFVGEFMNTIIDDDNITLSYGFDSVSHARSVTVANESMAQPFLLVNINQQPFCCELRGSRATSRSRIF
jgi:hypothetical protein